MDYGMDFAQDMGLGATLYDDASPDIWGVPNAQADFWDYQGLPDNCEPTSESFIIRQFGYDNISTNDFAYISQANGWYTPGWGTDPGHMGEMMDLFGIDNHTIENASFEQLASEIAAGHGVIVGVKADQLWEQGPLQDLFNWVGKQFGLDNPVDSPADHALCVTGIDKSDPEHPMVIINDPGDAEGQGVAYPLDRFMDAWENSNFTMTATNDPLPSFTELSIRDSMAQYLPDPYGLTGETALSAASDSSGSDFFGDFFEFLLPVLADVGKVILQEVGASIADALLPPDDNVVYFEGFAYFI